MESLRREIVQYLKEVLACRLCRNVALLVLSSILLIEGAILVPSYRNYERDLLVRLAQVGGAVVGAGLRNDHHDGADDIIAAGRLMLMAPEIAGGAIYAPDGRLIGTFGEAPALKPSSAQKQSRSRNGERYAVVYEGKALKLPFDTVANLRADWIEGDLKAFLWRIISLVLLITGFVTLATMAVIGHFVLAPLLRLRDHLNSAAANPEDAGSTASVLGSKRRDELGEVMQQFDTLMQQVSKAHRSARERLAAMVDNSTDAVFAAEPDGRLTYANYAALRLSKVEDLEQLKHLALPLVVTPEGLEVPMAQYLPTAEGASEVELQNAEGERTICILGVNQLAGSDGQANLHYAWAMDITARRQGEEALLRAVEDSQIANRAKTEFLANMSHELRTPLNAIIGFSEVIGGEIFGPLGHQQYSEYVRDIHSSGEHLLAIINDILDLSRVEAGVTTLMEAEVDLPTLIDDSVRIAQGRVDSGQTEITTRIDASPVHLLCDSRLLKQVLLNILSNALKFTPDHGEVRLATTRSRHGDLLITVADDGCGIPTDRLEDVLQPFTQIEDSYKRCHEGAGLGLPLSKQFMELHGGTLEIDSDHGRGTIVTLCLPATRLREGDAVVNSANV